MKLTIKQFYKSEHWSLKGMYILAAICFLFNFYYVMCKDPAEHTFFGLVAYGIMAIFGFRYEFTRRKKDL